MRSSVLCVFVGSLFAVAFGSTRSVDDALIHEIALTRFERLRNFIVDYKVTVKYTPAIPREAIVYRNPSGGLNIMNTGTRITRKQSCVLNDRYMYTANDESWDREVDHPDIPKVTPRKTDIYVRVPERCEQFHGDDRGTFTHMGEISNRVSLPGSGELELSIGLRRWYAPDLLTETDIKAMSVARTDDGKVSFRGLNHEGQTDEWLVDPDLDYAPLRYRVYRPEDNEVTVEYTMEDFRPVDGMMLPFKVHGTLRAGPNTVIQTTTVEVAGYRLNDPNNTPERYHIDWPEGTRIWDRRAGLGFRATDDALKYIGDERIAQIAIDQISSALTAEPNRPNVAQGTGDSGAVLQSKEPPIVEHSEGKNPVATIDVSHSIGWLWPVSILLFCVLVTGVLWLRARRSRLEQ